MKPLVLIGSCDADFYLLINHILEADGFRTLLTDNAKECVELARSEPVFAVVLDCHQDCDRAARMCASLKEDDATISIPVVALVAPGAQTLYVELLKAQIDEAFLRPMAPSRLLAFLQNLAQRKWDRASHVLEFGDLTMQLDTRRVRCAGQKVHLGPIEFRLLRHFMENPGYVFSRDELISAVWPQDAYVDPRTVDVHVGRLRRSLSKVLGENIIRTVRSVGYALNDHSKA